MTVQFVLVLWCSLCTPTSEIPIWGWGYQSSAGCHRDADSYNYDHRYDSRDGRRAYCIQVLGPPEK